RLVARLDAAFHQEEELLGKFTEENSLVKANKTFIASLENQKKEMETANPGLLEEAVGTGIATGRSGDRQDGRPTDLTVETARVAALEARLRTLTAQYEKIKTEA